MARPQGRASSTRRPGARSTCSTSTARSRPSRCVYASDYPYGQQPSSLLIARQDRAPRRLRRRPAARDARRQRERARRRRASCPSRPSRSGRDTLAHAAAARAHPPVPVDGDAAALVAPAGHGRRARPRDQHVRGAQRPRATTVDGIRELLVAARDLWATIPEIEEEVERAADDAAHAPARAHRAHRGGDACI